MFTRQKVLLAFLQAANRPVGRMELTKWSFLLRNETTSAGGSAFFDFVPYHYGPFSFSLYQEAGKLDDIGLLRSDGDQWAIGSTSSPNLAGAALNRDIATIVRKFSSWKIDSLIDYVYERYPAFTVHSKRKRLTEKTVAKPGIYTCGYEGQSVDAFLNELVASGIQRLIDVRMNPVARRYGFHKSTLGKLCEKLEIEYVHVPELGIASELRQGLSNQAAYDTLFEKYRDRTLKQEHEAIGHVCELVQSKPSVLVCMEHEACRCHRSHLADAVSLKTGLAVNHLRQEDAAV